MAPLHVSNSLPAFPHTYRFHVSSKLVRSFADPHDEEITIHRAYIPVSELKRELLPDDINPRSHESPSGRIPDAIETSLITSPKDFHLLNRGVLIIAQACKYDNHGEMLEVTISSAEDGGVADGGTTDRVLARAVDAASRKNSLYKEEDVEDALASAFVQVEIITGLNRDRLTALAGSRNTSNQVKEFALENLGGGFKWLKEVLEKSQLKGRVRYRENDPEPVDVRSVLALLTMFHNNWNQDGKDPLVAYTSKGGVLNYFRNPEWLPGYQALRGAAVDILRLYDHVHIAFPDQYQKYNLEVNHSGSKFGKRREITYKEKSIRLALTQQETRYVIPDGWLYPIVASLRMLLEQKNGKESTWVCDPFDYFNEHGAELVGIVVEQSAALGYNPQSVGKSRPLWSNLRKTVELERMKIEASKA